jgi:hypothetical protein
MKSEITRNTTRPMLKDRMSANNGPKMVARRSPAVDRGREPKRSDALPMNGLRKIGRTSERKMRPAPWKLHPKVFSTCRGMT